MKTILVSTCMLTVCLLVVGAGCPSSDRVQQDGAETAAATDEISVPESRGTVDQPGVDDRASGTDSVDDTNPGTTARQHYTDPTGSIEFDYPEAYDVVDRGFAPYFYGDDTQESRVSLTLKQQKDYLQADYECMTFSTSAAEALELIKTYDDVASTVLEEDEVAAGEHAYSHVRMRTALGSEVDWYVLESNGYALAWRLDQLLSDDELQLILGSTTYTP